MALPSPEKTDRQQVIKLHVNSLGCNNQYKMFIFAPFTS